jgi:cyclic pyranopterin phosphate synthase
MIDVQFGYACNVQCDYCSITDEMRLEKMSTATVLAQLKEARDRGAVKVSFGGGEPTIRRGLLPLVRWCRDRGYRSIKVASNGMMYSYRWFAEQAVDAGSTTSTYR